MPQVVDQTNCQAQNIVAEKYFYTTQFIWIYMGENAEIFPLKFWHIV
jgi:hypothetical protein